MKYLDLFQVKENDKKNLLGKLTLPLVRLLNMSDMTLDQRFQLERSGANSQIKLKAVLRVSELKTFNFATRMEWHTKKFRVTGATMNALTLIALIDFSFIPD